MKGHNGFIWDILNLKCLRNTWAFQVALGVKNLPANAGVIKMWVLTLGWEDPLEEGMATHSSIPAWIIPMDRGAWQPTVHGVTKSQTRLKLLSTQEIHKRSYEEINIRIISIEVIHRMVRFFFFPGQDKCTHMGNLMYQLVFWQHATETNSDFPKASCKPLIAD